MSCLFIFGKEEKKILLRSNPSWHSPPTDSRFLQTCLLRGFTFTFIVLISVFVPGRWKTRFPKSVVQTSPLFIVSTSLSLFIPFPQHSNRGPDQCVSLSPPPDLDLVFHNPDPCLLGHTIDKNLLIFLEVDNCYQLS